MSFTRSAAIWCVATAMSVAGAGAQGSISGSVYDSLSAHGPLANATVVLVERNLSATADARGRFTFDSVPPGRYSIVFTHAVLDSLGVKVPETPVEVIEGQRATVRLFTPSRATAATMVMRSRVAAMRAAARESSGSDSTPSTFPRAQKMATVAVNERAPTMSLMERDGFEIRRAQGLGAFVTEQDIARHDFADLATVLQKVKGVHVEFGPIARSESGISSPMPYLVGITRSKSGVNCVPNYFIDGAPVQVRGNDDYRDVTAKLPPAWIKGIEVYSNPGTIPAQYDLVSSTGCGSIVIWTR